MQAIRLLPIAFISVIGPVACFGELSDEATAQVVAEVRVIPTGVGCLRVVYRLPGATADTTRSFTVTPGTSAALDFGYLAAGSYSFRANAFNVACGSVNNSTVASWVGDTVSATLSPGIPARIAFTLRPNVPTTSTVDFVQPVRAIYAGAGSNSTYAVMHDGTVRAWGLNSQGQLGNGTTATSDLPQVVAGLTNPTNIDASDSYACAATSAGLACWGNFQGRLADDGPSQSLVPRFNPDIEPNAVVAGSTTLCGIFEFGLQCWHSVESLGGGSMPATAAVISPLDWAGRALLFLHPQGGLYRALTQSPPYIEFVADRTLGVAASGNSICRVRADRGVSCRSQTSTSGETFNAEVCLPLSDVTGLHAGYEHVCALLADRTVWCWGWDAEGQLGASGAARVSAVPLAVSLTDVTQIAAGARHTCALRADGAVWCWGDNRHGQLGDGTRTNRFSPVRARF